MGVVGPTVLVPLAAVALVACGGSSGNEEPAVRTTRASTAREFPRPRTAVPELEPVVEAWARSAEFHELGPPASADDFAELERLLGRKFPPAFRALYEMGDGSSYLQGNLMLDRLRGGGRFMSVATHSDDMRQASASLPPEVVVFASDGSDMLFGLWLPKGRPPDAPAPVVELEIAGGPIALVGTDLVRFLKARTAYYLIIIEADPAALGAVGVPEKLRVSAYDADDDVFYALRKWADPDLPNPRASAYDAPTDVAEVRRRYGADERP